MVLGRAFISDWWEGVVRKLPVARGFGLRKHGTSFSFYPTDTSDVSPSVLIPAVVDKFLSSMLIHHITLRAMIQLFSN